MSKSVLIVTGSPSSQSSNPFAWRESREGAKAVSNPGSKTGRRAPGAVGAALVLALVAALGGLAVSRSPYARFLHAPPTSLHLPWSGAEVRVENLTSRLVDQGRTLLVEGVVVNTAGRDIPSPTLRLAVRSADQAEIFVWAARPAESHLAPEARTRFSSRLASPPSGGVEVTVALQPAGS
jgi:hypothetical protein